MSRKRLTPLLLLVVVLALAVAPAMADNGVKVTYEFAGSSKDGFKILGENSSGTDKHCTVHVEVTKKDGSPKQEFVYKDQLVAGRSGPQSIGGEGGLTELTDVKITSESCK